MNTGVSDLDRLRAVIRGDVWLEIAALFEDTTHRSGRPRDFRPHVLVLYWLAVMNVWESARNTEVQLADRDIWRVLRRAVKRRLPDDRSMWLPRKPPRRHHYIHFRRTLLDPAWDVVRDIHEQQSAGQAQAVGLCMPDGPGSLTHPHTSRLLRADGKVKTPLFRSQRPVKVDRVTGEIRAVRHDPDATLHRTGGGHIAHGNKFEILSVRGTGPHQRVILSVDAVADGGEGRVLLDMLDRVAPRVPGAAGLVCDGVLRGTHRNHILQRNGLLPISPPHGSGADTIPAPRYLDTTIDGLSLFTYNGALGIGQLNEAGEVVHQPLPPPKILRRPRADGTVRWLLEYASPDGRTILQRQDQTPDDDARGFNRCEHLCGIAPGYPAYAITMGRRNEIESINRALEDSLYIGRAHSIGRDRQRIDLLGFAIGVNALAVYRHGAHAPPREVAA